MKSIHQIKTLRDTNDEMEKVLLGQQETSGETKHFVDSLFHAEEINLLRKAMQTHDINCQNKIKSFTQKLDSKDENN